VHEEIATDIWLIAEHDNSGTRGYALQACLVVVGKIYLMVWQGLIVAEANMKSVGLATLFDRTESSKSLYDRLGSTKGRGPIWLNLLWEVFGILSVADDQSVLIWCRIEGPIIVEPTIWFFIFSERIRLVYMSYLRKHAEDCSNRSVRRGLAGRRVEDHLSIPLLGGSCSGGILEQTVTEPS
jgi:hypothetical protein